MMEFTFLAGAMIVGIVGIIFAVVIDAETGGKWPWLVILTVIAVLAVALWPVNKVIEDHTYALVDIHDGMGQQQWVIYKDQNNETQSQMVFYDDIHYHVQSDANGTVTIHRTHETSLMGWTEDFYTADVPIRSA